MTTRNVRKGATPLHWLIREYGPVLSAAATAKLLGFGNTGALRQARARGRLPIPMFVIEKRRGWFASTAAVAAWIEQTTNVPSASGGVAIGGMVMPEDPVLPRIL